MVRTAGRLEALRYSRLETCATTLSAALVWPPRHPLPSMVLGISFCHLNFAQEPRAVKTQSAGGGRKRAAAHQQPAIGREHQAAQHAPEPPDGEQFLLRGHIP